MSPAAGQAEQEAPPAGVPGFWLGALRNDPIADRVSPWHCSGAALLQAGVAALLQAGVAALLQAGVAAVYSLTPAAECRAGAPRFCGCVMCSDRGRLISWGGPSLTSCLPTTDCRRIVRPWSFPAHEHSLGTRDCIWQTRVPVPGPGSTRQPRLCP